MTCVAFSRSSSLVLRPVSGLTLALMLAACGGGGGGGVGSTPTPVPSPTPTPAPTPTPTPAPTPTPTPGTFNTAEYRASSGLALANAIPAYEAGASGQGVLAGVIDSGIDVDSTEFAGRISTASADVAGSRGLQDVDGHGTAVAGILGAARNGSGTHGVAYEANLLVLRTDTPGTCASSSGSCDHADSAIARALDIAVASDARVVNISLGGSAPNAALRTAIDRATAAGVVIVISAGNDGRAEVDPFAAIATEAAIARGLVIVAGATNGSGTISSFSNRAGAARDVYVTALGEDVRANDQDGVAFSWSGTSFAAPHVAGAVALLAQAFPMMSGKEIVDLLLSSARDAGATGVDTVYGHGLLDIGRAFRPMGAMSIAGSSQPVALGDTTILSTAMGDAGQGAAGYRTIMLDGYRRPYEVRLSGVARGAVQRRSLAPALESASRTMAAGGGNMMVALTVTNGRDGVSVERLLLSGSEARTARAMAGSIATRLGASTDARFAIAQGADRLVADLGGRHGGAFLVARDAAGDMGFDRRSDSAFGIRHRLGGFGLTVAGEMGDALVYSRDGIDSIRHRYRGHGYAAAGVTLDRRFGGLQVALGVTRLVEDRTILGARFDSAFGARGGRSLFADADLRWRGGDGWSLGLSARQGWTRVTGGGGALAGAATLRSNAFALDVGKHGLFGGGDSLAFRFAQPLRVGHGGLGLRLPVAYDYRVGVTAYEHHRIDLAPEGRELDYELRYDRPFWAGRLGINLYRRSQPGHYRAAPDDLGGALRFHMGF